MGQHSTASLSIQAMSSTDSSSSGSSVDIRVIHHKPLKEVRIDAAASKDSESKLKGDSSTDQSDKRPRLVIHLKVIPGGPIVFGTSIRLQVLRSEGQEVTVYTGEGVRQSTNKNLNPFYSINEPEETVVWRKDHKPIKLHIEIRDEPEEEEEEEWEEPPLKRYKSD